ncbi:lamin tail domain-containing protein [Rathayibacter sp. CAU 1779]
MRLAALRPAVVTASALVLAVAGLVAVPATASASPAASSVAITEFAYGGLIGGSSVGGDGEYVEVTNVGASAVDVSGWSYGTTAAPGTVSLSGFGTLAAGESAIITDVTPAEFRADWGLKDSVKVVNDGSTTLNNGPKTMYLFDADGSTVDSVSYASGFLSGGKGQSAWVDADHVGAKSDTTGWTFSTVGDEQESWTSATGSVGSPGTSSLGIGDASAVRNPISGGGDGGAPPATDPNWADIVINEVTSDNDSIGFAPLPTLSDGVELYNKGTHDVSVAGWKQIDSGAATAATDFSGSLYVNGVLSTTIPAGGYGVFQSTKGLSSGGDAVKIYTPDGTLVDSVEWTAGQAGVDETVNADHTYKSLARCPDGGSTYLEVTAASFGTSNAAACATGVPPLTSGSTPEAPCQTEDSGDAPGTVPADATTWPGSATPATIDAQCAWVTSESGQDLSGLAFDPSHANVLYAVKNKSHVWRLLNEDGTWVKDTANGWADGKDIRFPNGSGAPDSEGLTVGPDGALYITTERDNDASNVPLDSILRFDPTTSATTISATDQWVLTDDLGFAPTDAADSNLGFEGVAFVPDGYLTANGFRTDAGTLYNPADYPNKAASGLFFGAIEKTGHLRAYVLNTDHTYTRVADIDSGLAGVMDDSFDADLGGIWAHCDNTCGNATTFLGIGGDGHFQVEHTYARPAGLPNYNLEGFAVAPASTAVDGQRQVLWTDDGNRFGHSLWAGTLSVDLSTAPGGSGSGVVLKLGSSSVKPGDPITVTAGGLTAGTTYTVTLHSTPVELASGSAGSDGSLTLTGTIPADTTAGAHTITVADAADPDTVLASAPLTVEAAGGDAGTAAGSGSLASTGSDPLPMLLGSAALLLLGVGALGARRLARRRRA